MGADFYTCFSCLSAFSEYEDYTHCHSCDERWCESCSAGVDNFAYYHGDRECTDCSKHMPMTEKTIPVDKIYKYAFKKLGVEFDDLETEYIQGKEKKRRKLLSCQKCKTTECDHLWENTVIVACAYTDEKVASHGTCCKCNENENKGSLCDVCEK